MHSITTKKLFYLLLCFWFIIDFIQISTTGIIHDESYYYVWSQYLDWGYFDHPPMVAILIFLGDLFFDGSIAVRFFSVLLHLFTVLLLWKTLDSKYKQSNTSVLYFFGMTFTLPMFSIYGFITTPDSALLFFFALSAWAFKHFLTRRKFLDLIWLSIGLAGMVLSKYHAFLIISLVLIINWQLVKERRFWILFAIAIILIIPHFIWLYEHDFITFKYHLIERSKSFKIKYLLEYIPNQFAVLNPFYLSLFLFLIFRKTLRNRFEQTMKFTAIGILVFFAFMTLKGRVEAHWTTIASIPLFFIVFPYLIKLSKQKKYVKYTVSSFVILILISRVLIAFDILPGVNFDKEEVEYNKKLNAFVENKPVVFIGSFQEPSSYYYATKGAPTSTIPYYRKRETQFELWAWYEDFLGQPVFVSQTTYTNSKQHKYEGETFRGYFVDYYQDSRLIDVDYDIKETRFKKGKEYYIDLEIFNTSAIDYNFKDKLMPLQIQVAFVGKDPIKTKSVELPLKELKILKANDSQVFRTQFKVPKSLDEKNYFFNISIKSKLGFTTNSKDTLVEIID